jgi:transcriptional regulator with GAF, ATPase, and Fis domain
VVDGGASAPSGSNRPAILLEFQPSVSQAIRRQLESAIRDVAAGRDSDVGDSYRVLVFDSVDDELQEQVRVACSKSPQRLLAIAVGQSPDLDDAWSLLEAGACDAVGWTGEFSSIAARIDRWREIDELVTSAATPVLVGSSPQWIAALRDIVEAARYSSASILLVGETGTGKELAANLVHDLDSRPDKGALVTVDCTTIVDTLAGSEFFGHERGAFTGAVATREGAFELADGGTLFLDELGELAPTLQGELLRVVQEGTFKRIGSNSWRRTRFRLVSATNRDLETETLHGRFREDLLQRIAVFTCRLPALDERREDIPVLAAAFLREVGATPDLEPALRDYLLRRHFRGNVRELRRLVVSAAQRHVGPGPLSLGDLPASERPTPMPIEIVETGLERWVRRAVAAGSSLREISAAATDAAVAQAIDAEGGNISAAARRLGVTARALQLRRAAARARRVGDEDNVMTLHSPDDVDPAP